MRLSAVGHLAKMIKNLLRIEPARNGMLAQKANHNTMQGIRISVLEISYHQCSANEPKKVAMVAPAVCFFFLFFFQI